MDMLKLLVGRCFMDETLRDKYRFLIDEAKRVMGYSYAPYSGIHVAAALVTDRGKTYVGVNVENSSYGLTICAERSAIASMIAGGDRKPIAIAIVTDYDKPIPPCGACRQVLAEFNPDMLVIMHCIRSGETVLKSLRELFPDPFKI